MLDLDWDKLEELDKDGNFAPAVKVQSGKYAKTQQFPCTACGGSGKFHGRRTVQDKSHCFACGGKGYFMTSAADRAKKRQQAQGSKAKRLADAQAAFVEQNPDIAAFLNEAHTWSTFAGAMCEALGLAVRRLARNCAA